MGEAHDTQSANPVRQRAPEKDGVRLRVDVVHDGGSRGGEARHGFEERLGNVVHAPADVERQHPEQGEQYPRQRGDAVAVALAQPPFRLASGQDQQSGGCGGDGGRPQEACRVALGVEPRHAGAAQKHQYLYHEQHAQHPANHPSVDEALVPFPLIGIFKHSCYILNYGINAVAHAATRREYTPIKGNNQQISRIISGMTGRT